jgi:Spy/CpxP family protein refolding chaperone
MRARALTLMAGAKALAMTGLTVMARTARARGLTARTRLRALMVKGKGRDKGDSIGQGGSNDDQCEE